MVHGLPVFMDSVPEYSVRNGRMYVTLANFQLVMPLSVFQQGAARAAEAIAKWQLAQLDRPKAKVVKLKARTPKH